MVTSPEPFAKNVELVGYHDLDGKPGLKLAMQEKDGRFYLYIGGFWHPGWHVLDVTDPTDPTIIAWLEGPRANSATYQVQVADDKLVCGVERVDPFFGGDIDAPFDEGIYIWDISNPREPALLSHWQTGATGTHRNFYDGGRYVHAAISAPGFDSEFYAVLDIEDPTDPKVVGRWWWPGQHTAGGEEFSDFDQRRAISGRALADEAQFWLHGGPYVQGDKVFCGWARAGLVILDIADVRNPHLAGNLSFYPPLGSTLAAHTAVPLPEHSLAIVNSESLMERADEPLAYAAVVDVADVSDPILVSLFPLPEVPATYPARDFADRGGRFGPHNQHQPQNQKCLMVSDNYVYLTYFSAGLQIFDISNPRRPTNVGYYIPEDPPTRISPEVDPTELVAQVDDVIVDRRGYIYITEKNSGLRVLKFTPPAGFPEPGAGSIDWPARSDG